MVRHLFRQQPRGSAKSGASGKPGKRILSDGGELLGYGGVLRDGRRFERGLVPADQRRIAVHLGEGPWPCRGVSSREQEPGMDAQSGDAGQRGHQADARRGIPTFLDDGPRNGGRPAGVGVSVAHSDFAAQRAAFRKLHESGCFVIPNPWDIGTARYLRHLGFPALATTSSGLSFSRGLPDTDWAVPRDVVLGHIAEVGAAVDLPVNADFESGYAHDPEGVAASVRLCVETGVAGLSIEDATGDRSRPLYDLTLAVERIRAARKAIDASGADVLLTGRAECYLVGHAEPLKESIRRLEAYAEAGADVLYAPGPRERADIKAIVEAVSPKPVNL